MSFGQPWWFWAFALFPVLLGFFWANERRRGKLLRQLVAIRLQERLAGTVSVGRRRFRFGLLLLALACLVVSLAQPRLGYTWEQSKRQGRDVLIAIDCSRSMLATDLAPNRLGRAKLAAQDFIGQLQGDRVGLIAFAGSAFLQAPLTIDYGAVLNSLTELDTDIIPRGGTNITAAIKEAVDAFGKGESDNRCLIIFTDGEELYADAVTAAAEQNGKIKIFTVGLGSADGSLIPMPGRDGGTEFVKDENGQIVKSKLDEDRLRKIAEATGGFYVHLASGPAEMQQIIRTGLGQMKEQEIDARMSRRPIERYQWPLAAGLVLLVGSTLISERKRVVRRRASIAALTVLVLLQIMPAGVQAKNDGLEAYNRQDYKGAMDEFGRQIQRRGELEALNFNLGAAAYKSGDFGKALESFAKAVTSSNPQLRGAAEYNLGNTLFQRGAGSAKKDDKIREWKDALQHYEQALQVEPQNKNAEYNRDLVNKLLAELQQQPPPDQQQQQKKDQDKDKKDQDKKDQDQKDEQKNGQDQKQQQDQQSKDGKQDKDQQGQQKDQKDQQSQESKGQQGENKPQDGAQQNKDQQGKDQQDKDQQGKGEEKGTPQDQSGKGSEKKDAQNNPAGDAQDAASDKDGKKQEKPQPSPEQSDKKKAGDIKAQQGAPQPNDPQQEAAAEAQAAEEGRMTPKQAETLLDSLKTEDDRVQLLRQGERRQARPLRDW